MSTRRHPPAGRRAPRAARPGAPPPGDWDPNQVRRIIASPTNAGIRSHNGEEEVDSIFEVFAKRLVEEGFGQPRYEDKIRASVQGWLLELGYEERYVVEDAVVCLFHIWPSGSRLCNNPANPLLFEEDLNSILASGRGWRAQERHPAAVLTSQAHAEVAVAKVA